MTTTLPPRPVRTTRPARTYPAPVPLVFADPFAGPHDTDAHTPTAADTSSPAFPAPRRDPFAT